MRKRPVVLKVHVRWSKTTKKWQVYHQEFELDGTPATTVKYFCEPLFDKYIVLNPEEVSVVEGEGT